MFLHKSDIGLKTRESRARAILEDFLFQVERWILFFDFILSFTSITHTRHVEHNTKSFSFLSGRTC